MTENNSMTANGDMTFTMGGITVPFGSWEYKVSTLYAACELSLLDSLEPTGGKCLVCGQPTKIGERLLHPAGTQHIATVKIPGTFPVTPQGQTIIPAVWDVAVQRGANVLVNMKFQLAAQPQQPKGSLMMNLVLRAHVPLKSGPKIIESADGSSDVPRLECST